jgi:hypothetical protein
MAVISPAKKMPKKQKTKNAPIDGQQRESPTGSHSDSIISFGGKIIRHRIYRGKRAFIFLTEQKFSVLCGEKLL